MGDGVTSVNLPIGVSIIPLVSAVWPIQRLEQAPLRVAEEVPRLDLGHQQLGQVSVGGGEVVVRSEEDSLLHTSFITIGELLT